MGRLRKVKIDEIVQLRNAGYTQQETAERAAVNLKTVRNYDPLKQPRHAAPLLEERVRCLEHLVHYLTGIAVVTANYLPTCPHCEGQDLLPAEGKETETSRRIPEVHTWACPKCGFFVDTYPRIGRDSIVWVDSRTGSPAKSPLGHRQSAPARSKRTRGRGSHRIGNEQTGAN